MKKKFSKELRRLFRGVEKYEEDDDPRLVNDDLEDVPDDIATVPDFEVEDDD